MKASNAVGPAMVIVGLLCILSGGALFLLKARDLAWLGAAIFAAFGGILTAAGLWMWIGSKPD